MAGHSRLKDGVTSARLCPAIHAFLSAATEDLDARDKPGHDEELGTPPTAANSRIGIAFCSSYAAGKAPKPLVQPLGYPEHHVG